MNDLHVEFILVLSLKATHDIMVKYDSALVVMVMV